MPMLVSLVAQTVKNLPAMQETWVWSLGWEDPLEEDMATHSSILAWRFPMDRGAWQVRVHGVAKSQIWLNNFHFHFIWFMKILCIILGYNPAATICLWGFSTSLATSSNSHTADNSHTSTCPGTLSSHPLHSVWVGGGCWDYLMSTYIYVKEFMMHLLLLFIW